jgi:pSer/pThr/pTyr-binding forkhead associated (FHA) protein
VNDQRVSSVPLNDGDVIRFGVEETKFVFRAVQAPAAPAAQPPGPMRARLEPISGRGTPFEFTGDEVIIGRDEEDCDLVLPEEDTSISRQHARIRRTPSGFVLEDTSSNGTFVNDQEFVQASTPLEDGDEICFGLRDTRFTFHVGGPA